MRAIRAGRCRERRYADHIFIPIYSQNEPFCSQIFKISFASGGKGALTPLIRILQTFLLNPYPARGQPVVCPHVGWRGSKRRNITYTATIDDDFWTSLRAPRSHVHPLCIAGCERAGRLQRLSRDRVGIRDGGGRGGGCAGHAGQASFMHCNQR